MKKLLVAAVLAVGLPLVAGVSNARSDAPPDSARTARIRELLDVMGIGELGVQVAQGIMAQLQSVVPGVPREWWAAFQQRVDASEIVDLIVPIYDKHLTDAELDAMLRFYNTPEGRSVVLKLPIMTQDSMRLGQHWGAHLAERIIRELTQDGYDVPKNLRL